MFLGGQEIPWLPESLRLFALSEAMKFAHLPLAGGLYDQDPDLLDDWLIIFKHRSEHHKAEAAKNEAKAKSKTKSTR